MLFATNSVQEIDKATNLLTDWIAEAHSIQTFSKSRAAHFNHLIECELAHIANISLTMTKILNGEFQVAAFIDQSYIDKVVAKISLLGIPHSNGVLKPSNCLFIFIVEVLGLKLLCEPKTIDEYIQLKIIIERSLISDCYPSFISELINSHKAYLKSKAGAGKYSVFLKSNRLN